MSTVSSFSSCLLLSARVAVARALFLAMNSSSCLRLVSTAALVRLVLLAPFFWYSRKASILPGNRVSLPRLRSSVWEHVA